MNSKLESTSASFKIFLHSGDQVQQVRRIGASKDLTWKEFLELVSQLFSLEPNDCKDLRIQYQDDEGDIIDVSSAQEWSQTLLVFSSQNLLTYKLNVYLGSQKETFRFHCKKQVHSQTTFEKVENSTQRGLQQEKVSSESSGSPTNTNTNTSLPASLEMGSIIRLRCEASKKNLRILDDGSVDGNGKKGKRTLFKVHSGLTAYSRGSCIRLQSVHNPNYWLRIFGSKGQEPQLDGKGHGGPFTEFKVHVHKHLTEVDTVISLRSMKYDSKAGVGIVEDGSRKKGNCTGFGVHGRFLVLSCNEEKKN